MLSKPAIITAMICAAYGENAILHVKVILHVKDKIKNFAKKISVLKINQGCPQKIEMDELQALLDINSAQTEKRFAE